MSDTEDLSPEEAMLKRHRKEKKELQGKIQGMKKQASKGDKKKKKEVQEEVAKMEHELDARHEQELKDLGETGGGDKTTEEVTEQLESTSIASDEPVASGGERVSKAQKRRDKKAQKERERLEDIERQEEQNKFGVRQVESDKISAVLRSRNLALVSIPSDGDCLFAGVADQLAQKQNVTMTVAELRTKTVQELKSNAAEYMMFLTHPTTGDLLTEAQFNKYCHDMEHTAVWGGQVEISALAKVLETPVEVLQAEGPPMLVGEQFKKAQLVLTYHRHMYGLGEHYNSTKAL